MDDGAPNAKVPPFRSATVFANTQSFSNGRVDNDAWHWVAAVNSGGTISLYIDGVKQTDGGVMQPTSTATSPAATEAFFGKIGAVTPFAGQLDDWRIYSHALGGTLQSSSLTGGELFDVWQANVPEPGGLTMLAVAATTALRRRRLS